MSSEKPTPDSDDTRASEETKRKFREALERKKQRAEGRGTDHLDGESSIHSAHGPETHQREFRRKSG
jgi:hypothetical protein